MIIGRNPLAELRTSFYVTFVIAVATALTVRMIFAIDPVMKSTVAVIEAEELQFFGSDKRVAGFPQSTNRRNPDSGCKKDHDNKDYKIIRSLAKSSHPRI